MVNDFLEYFGPLRILELAFNVVDLILIVIAFKIATKLLTKFAYKVVKTNLRNISERRVNTICTLFRDIIMYTMLIIEIIIILTYIGIDLKLIITSIGIVGVVIGVAGQELIRDFLNGFFTIIEGYYDIGDYIKIREYEGYVVDFRLKSTILETYNKELIVVPNSKIYEIINYSKNKHLLFHKVSISYYTDISNFENNILNLLIKDALVHEDINSVKYLGIDELGDSQIDLLFQIDTDASTRFSAKRHFNKCALEIFSSNGIEIPFNQIVTHISDQR